MSVITTLVGSVAQPICIPALEKINIHSGCSTSATSSICMQSLRARMGSSVDVKGHGAAKSMAKWQPPPKEVAEICNTFFLICKVCLLTGKKFPKSLLD